MNAKQEILDALNSIGRSVAGFTPEEYAQFRKINAILSTHTLEPIGDRPFDPTLCGFQRIHDNIWKNDICTIIQAADRLFDVVMNNEQIPFYLEYCQWPATQSDGERLLKLLGVLK